MCDVRHVKMLHLLIILEMENHINRVINKSKHITIQYNTAEKFIKIPAFHSFARFDCYSMLMLLKRNVTDVCYEL